MDKGVAVGLGTDGAASNNNLDVLEEARLAALVHKCASSDPTAIPAQAAFAWRLWAGRSFGIAGADWKPRGGKTGRSDSAEEDSRISALGTTLVSDHLFSSGGGC